MIILGIDPGTATTGYAIIRLIKNDVPPEIIECSVITTPAKTLMHHRLKLLHDSLNEIIIKHTPEVLVIERLFFNTNVKTAMSVGQARGVPLLLAANHNLRVFEYTALQAKRILTGYGRSTKKEMQEAVMRYFNLSKKIKSDDANDALAMALCFLDRDCKKFGKIENTNTTS